MTKADIVRLLSERIDDITKSQAAEYIEVMLTEIKRALARGERVLLPPLDAQGRGTRATRLERALDFAAVTDHAEYFGEISICLDPDDPAYGSANCVGYRGADGSANAIVNRMAALMGVSPAVAARNVDPVRPPALCGEDGERCAEGMRSLVECGLAKAARSITSIEEVLRIAPRGATE